MDINEIERKLSVLQGQRSSLVASRPTVAQEGTELTPAELDEQIATCDQQITVLYAAHIVAMENGRAARFGAS